MNAVSFDAFTAAVVIKLLHEWKLRKSLCKSFETDGDHVLSPAIDLLLQGGLPKLGHHHHHTLPSELRSLIPDTINRQSIIKTLNDNTIKTFSAIYVWKIILTL